MKISLRIAEFAIAIISSIPILAAANSWDGQKDCTGQPEICPSNSSCVNHKCVSSFGSVVDSPGCHCCACEDCVCEKRPECCSPDGYWDDECVALCSGECGGYALDVDKVDCAGRQCGWDGCFGSCGTCGPGLKCVDGTCQTCVPECAGKECGSDGCGGLCGLCDYWAGESCIGSLFPSLPEQKCIQVASVTVPVKGCCISDSVVANPDGETTCSEGYICRWERSLYWDDNNIGEYGCFADYSDSCPQNFDIAACLQPENWDFRCCKESPYLEYPLECDFSPHAACEDYWDCGPDGVGGSCGACAEDERCVWFQCWECVHDCSGRECGSDGCGGSCGDCGEGLTCIAGQCIAGSGCGRIGQRGCCVGDVLVECVNGRLLESECNPLKGTEYEIVAPYCMWKNGPAPIDYTSDEWTLGSYAETDERYECGTVNEYSTHLVTEDPSGEYPRECDFTPCTKDCTGKSCGDDGCGGTCGGCGDHRDCVDHQCTDRIPEPTPDVVEPIDAVDADEPEVVEASDTNDADGNDDGDVPATDTVRDDMTPDSAPDARHDADTNIDTHGDTTNPADTITESEPSPGCGCTTSAPPAGPGSGVLFVLLLCLAVVTRARLKTQRK